MIITYNKKQINQIDTIQELIDYINNRVIKDGHRILKVKDGYETIISEWVHLGITINHKNVWSVYKQLINSKCTRNIQIGFWLDRGYSKNVATKKVSQIQSNRTKKGFVNGSFGNRLLPSHIEYWTKKGYLNEEAKAKVKERQATFSLDICIKKHGEVEGTKIFNDRQTKWQSSLDHNSFDTSVTWELYLNKYKSYSIALKKWLLLANSRRSDGCIPNPIIQKLIQLEFKSSIDILNYLLDEVTPYDVIKSAALLSAINMSKMDFLESYFKQNNIEDLGPVSIKSGVYGNRYYYKGQYYESNFELEIGLVLLDMGLEFICHKQYPNSARKYDFYIPTLETYIEAMGMPNKSYNKKILELDHLNIIWSDSTEEIVNNLLKINTK
jgi:hypothetical protein